MKYAILFYLSFCSVLLAGQVLEFDRVGTLDFSSPVDLVATGISGDDRLFVVERAGVIRIIDNLSTAPTELSTPFLNISSGVLCCGEKGLLGLAFDPNYATNGHFFVNYMVDGPRRTRISRFTVSANPNVATAGSEEILLEVNQPYDNHNAGDLAFGPDGYLYIPMGDGGDSGDPDENGQDMTSLLGKILRIDVSTLPYSIPSDNPFLTPGDNIPDEIWSSGWRNPWRLSFDRQTGDMYVADVGQNAWEELDIEPAGSAGGLNYGWDCREGLAGFNDNSPTNGNAGCPAPSTFVDPVFTYPHDDGTLGGYSVTGGFVYRGSDYPYLNGTYIMTDYVLGQNFWLVESDGAGGYTTTLEKVSSGPTNVSTFGEDNRGELYLARLSGEIFQVTTSLVLPVEFGDFTARRNDARVDLHWQTFSEQNADRFEVQHSTDGRSWNTLGQVRATGNSETIQDYHFTDEQPVYGKNYYRLLNVDLDGSRTHSAVRVVYFDRPLEVDLYPNPVATELSLTLPEVLRERAYSVEIYSTTGALALRREYGKQQASTQVLEVSQLPEGSYLLRVRANEFSTDKIFMKLEK